MDCDPNPFSVHHRDAENADIFYIGAQAMVNCLNQDGQDVDESCPGLMTSVAAGEAGTLGIGPLQWERRGIA